MFVYVTNITQINNINIYMYVCSVWCLRDAERERRKRKKEWERVQHRPTYFLLFWEYHKPLFSLFWFVCLWGMKQAKNVGLLCVPDACLMYSPVKIFRSWKKFDLARKYFLFCLFIWKESANFDPVKDRVFPHHESAKYV